MKDAPTVTNKDQLAFDKFSEQLKVLQDTMNVLTSGKQLLDVHQELCKTMELCNRLLKSKFT